MPKLWDLKSYPPFVLDVYGHYDKLFDRTPFYQCRATIRPDQASLKKMKPDNEELTQSFDKIQPQSSIKNIGIPEEPKWHPLYRAPSDTE